MKRLLLIPSLAAALLGSCDHIDAVGDKVNELKDMRTQSTQGIDGAKLSDLLGGNPGQAGPAVQDIGEAEFQAFINQPGRINIVDFHADWCPPCKQLAPVLSAAVTAKPVARVGKINIDSAKSFASAQGVQGIPDVRFYVDGQLVERFVGGHSQQTVEAMIERHAASVSPPSTEALTAQLNAGLEGVAGGPATASSQTSVPIPPRSSGKPIEEAMQPMKKDWLPPGMSPKQ